MKAVDPSEIIINTKGKGTQENSSKRSSRPNPGFRFLARFFDYSLWISALYLLHRLFGGNASFVPYERLIPYEYVTWIPIEALWLYSWGKSPGKWLLGMRVAQGSRGRVEISTAFRRSFFVWMRGLGMMIPILNFLCLLVAYQRFTLLGVTSWDRDEFTQVHYEPIARWRVVFALTAVLTVTACRYLG